MVALLEMPIPEQYLNTKKERLYDYGGTDVSCIVGANNFKSKYQYWLEKTGRANDDFAGNERTHSGNILERVIIDEAEIRFGVTIQRSVKLSKEFPERGIVLGGEMDGVSRGKTDVIFEAKSVSKDAWRNVWKNGTVIPLHYDCQTCYYSALEGIRKVVFCIIVDNLFYFIEQIYDEADHNWVINQVLSFHDQHVVVPTPPEADGSKACSEYINGRASRDNLDFCDRDDLENIAQEIIDLKQTKKELETSIKEKENRLKIEIDEFDLVNAGDLKITYKPRADSISIDSAKIKKTDQALYERLIGQYGKTRSGGRPLLIK